MAQQINYSNIKNACDNLRSLAGSFGNTITELNTIIGKIKYPVWSGIASEAFVEKVSHFCEKLEGAKKTLATSALYLAGCADGYKSIDENSYNQLIDLIGGQAFIDSIDVNSLPDTDLNERISSQFSDNNTSTTPEASESLSNSNRATYSSRSYPSYNYSSTNYNIGNVTSVPFENTLEPKKSVSIPNSVRQSGYTVTCYGKGGWYLGGGPTPTRVAKGTKQEKVHDLWLANGARYKNGIAVININGVDRYLIAVSKTFGVAGDVVDIKLANGQVIPAILGDVKGSRSSTYGHPLNNGLINVLEFEVDRNKYNALGNPTTTKWGLDWDSSSPVVQIDNYGNIVL